MKDAFFLSPYITRKKGKPWTLYSVRAKAGLIGTRCLLIHMLPTFTGKVEATTGMQSLSTASKA
jgi:hypothetical protein